MVSWRDPETLLAVAGLIGSVLAIAVAVYEFLKVRSIQRVVRHFTYSRAFVRALGEIHESYTDLKVAARTPGLIHPTERNFPKERGAYFDIIERRLDGADGEYSLDYLFDIEEYAGLIQNDLDRSQPELVDEARVMLQKALKHAKPGPVGGRLKLRYRRFGTLALSMVIGGEGAAGLGYRPTGNPRNTEWIVTSEPALVRFLRHEFETAFSAPDTQPMTLEKFDELVQVARARATSPKRAT
jgi:hypothetical protein